MKKWTPKENTALVTLIQGDYEDNDQTIPDSKWSIYAKKFKCKIDDIKAHLCGNVLESGVYREKLHANLVKYLEKLGGIQDSDSDIEEDPVEASPEVRLTPSKRKIQTNESTPKKSKPTVVASDSEDLDNIPPPKKATPVTKEAPKETEREKKVNQLFAKLTQELGISDRQLWHGLFANNGNVLNTIRCFNTPDYDKTLLWDPSDDHGLSDQKMRKKIIADRGKTQVDIRLKIFEDLE